jgi:hypothetical protein
MPSGELSLLFECQCFTPEHMVRVHVLDWADDGPDFYIEVTADCHLPWHKRIWPAIKYLFGCPSLKWHDVMLSGDNVRRLDELIDSYFELSFNAEARKTNNQSLTKKSNEIEVKFDDKN